MNNLKSQKKNLMIEKLYGITLKIFIKAKNNGWKIDFQ